MNDFGVNRHTFMNDFGVLFHQNARIFLVIPLCQRSLVMSLCDVACAIGTLLMLSMLYVAGRRWFCCYVGWLHSANHSRELNRWGVAYLFYMSSFLRRRDTEPLPKGVISLVVFVLHLIVFLLWQLVVLLS